MITMEKKTFEASLIINEQKPVKAIELMDETTVEIVRDFHRTIPGYSPTPLIPLKGLADKLGVKKIYVKNEAYRFGLNAFKSLGGSYAVAKYLGERFGIADSDLSFQRLQKADVVEAVRQLTFISATDGNHGKGLAWFANKLGAKSVVYMPQNSVPARVEAIRNEGAEVTVTNMNYDDTVRLASERAEENGWILVQDTAWEGYEKIPAWITQGYSTMTLEALEQLDQHQQEMPTHAFLQAGVGSLAGSILGYLVNVLKEKMPKAVIVEPSEAACIFKSATIGDGQAHAVGGSHDTMMAGLACGEPNIETWQILRDHAYGFISCSDEVAAVGMKRLANPVAYDREIVSGESGAVGLGMLDLLMTEETLKAEKEALGLDETSVILLFSTEGDTDPVNYKKIVQ